MAIAIVLILLVVGSIIFHFWSPWWFTPIASNWGMIDDTVNITFWVTGIVFVAVNLFMAYAILRFRHRKGQKAAYEPENKRLETWLTVLTSVGVAAMLAPGLFVWAKVVTVPDGAMEVEAVGQQWGWSYRYPGRDNTFGTTAVRFMSPDNPFGIDPDDPNGQDDVLVDGGPLHLPVGKPVKLLLRSKDVLHNFAVPQFRVKMDLVPGMVSYTWLTPTRPGRFDVLCEELCGLAHFAMRSKVVVEDEASFDGWLSAQPTFAQATEMTPNMVAGRNQYAVCAACHGAEAEGNPALNAPRLAGLDRWYVHQQLSNYRNGARGTHEDDVYGKQMAPMAAVLPDEQAVRDVSAYIESLPVDASRPTTVVGNTAKGRSLYRTCGTCHGSAGEGVWSTHAPRLAGMDDWYLKRQLLNFRHGTRGAHPDDPHGQQMVLMSKILGDEQAVDDLVAYLNTL